MQMRWFYLGIQRIPWCPSPIVTTRNTHNVIEVFVSKRLHNEVWQFAWTKQEVKTAQKAKVLNLVSRCENSFTHGWSFVPNRQAGACKRILSVFSTLYRFKTYFVLIQNKLNFVLIQNNEISVIILCLQAKLPLFWDYRANAQLTEKFFGSHFRQ